MTEKCQCLSTIQEQVCFLLSADHRLQSLSDLTYKNKVKNEFSDFSVSKKKKKKTINTTTSGEQLPWQRKHARQKRFRSTFGVTWLYSSYYPWTLSALNTSTTLSSFDDTDAQFDKHNLCQKWGGGGWNLSLTLHRQLNIDRKGNNVLEQSAQVTTGHWVANKIQVVEKIKAHVLR